MGRGGSLTVNWVHTYNSQYAQHILEHVIHMGLWKKPWALLRTVRRGPHMNTLERYHIYKSSQVRIQIIDTYWDTTNPVLETLHKYKCSLHSLSLIEQFEGFPVLKLKATTTNCRIFILPLSSWMNCRDRRNIWIWEPKWKLFTYRVHK